MKLTIDADASAILVALTRLDEKADPVVDRVCFDTAQRIQREAKARVARRTGRTAEDILVEKRVTQRGAAYVVTVGADRAYIAFFLEFGTKFMTKREFFFASGRLEEGGHLQRMGDALQDAINAEGLGA